jgi:hypothetical protein
MAALAAQTRCVAGAHRIPVAIAEQVSTTDDGVVGLRLKLTATTWPL